MWATEHNTPAATDTDSRQQPRRPNDDQTDLADQVGRLDIDDAEEEEEGAEAAYSEYSHIPTSHSSGKQRSKSSSGKGKSKPSGSSSSKKKSKSTYTTDDTIPEQEEEEDDAGAGAGASAQYDGGNADACTSCPNRDSDPRANVMADQTQMKGRGRKTTRTIKQKRLAVVIGTTTSQHPTSRPTRKSRRTTIAIPTSMKQDKKVYENTSRAAVTSIEASHLGTRKRRPDTGPDVVNKVGFPGVIVQSSYY
jgi:hypothetical protein